MTQARERSATLSLYVAEEVRALLARRRMSGRQLAGLLGVSPSWVSYRLTGVQTIDLDDLQKVAEALNVPATSLIEPALAALKAKGNGAKEHLPDINHSTDPGRVSAPYSRHTAGAPGPMSPQRRDATRPQSAVPATKRRPTTLRSPSRPMAA